MLNVVGKVKLKKDIHYTDNLSYSSLNHVCFMRKRLNLPRTESSTLSANYWMMNDDLHKIYQSFLVLVLCNSLFTCAAV